MIIGQESQLPEPGDTLVQDYLGLPLTTLRDKNGEIGTFKNIGRHPGMRLAQDEGPTQLRSLVCPYHQWTYGLDGTLRNIPRAKSFTDIDQRVFQAEDISVSEGAQQLCSQGGNEDLLIWWPRRGRHQISHHRRTGTELHQKL
ncbi:MAG: phenylpropionate dioxygenase-like ring-hydroxylating dioxygenase large terminal subunit [Bacteroidia bacterium]